MRLQVIIIILSVINNCLSGTLDLQIQQIQISNQEKFQLLNNNNNNNHNRINKSINYYMSEVVPLFKNTTNNIFDNLYYYFKNRQLTKIIENFNHDSLIITREFEYSCVSLMNKLYIYDIFKYLRTSETINNINNENNEIFRTEFLDNMLKTFATIATSSVTGDINTPIALATDTMYNLYKYITKTTTKDINTKDIITKDIITNEVKLLEIDKNENNNNQNSLLSEEQVNELLFEYSKYYCLNVANLQIKIEDKNIFIIGDRENYDWILNMVKLLETNIEYIIKENLDIKDKKDNNKKENYNKIIKNTLLNDLKQRLFILRTIMLYLKDLTYYSVETYFRKQLLVHNDYNTNNNIEIYLNTVIVKLYKQLDELNSNFPKQKRQVNYTKGLMEKQHNLTILENEIIYLLEKYKEYRSAFETNITSLKLKDYKEKTVNYFKYYNEKVSIYSEQLTKSIKIITKKILDIPGSTIDSIIENILSYVFNLFFNINTIVLFIIYTVCYKIVCKFI